MKNRTITIRIFVAILAMAAVLPMPICGAEEIVSWGNNNYGQATPPGGIDFVAVAAGDGHSLALRSDGSLIGWGANGYGQATPPAGTDFVAVAAGAGHNLALRSDGSLVGWGYNNMGQASPPGGTDFVAVAAGVYHSLALRSDGSLVGWGANNVGQATPPAGTDFVAVGTGRNHGIALKADGSLVGWGGNAFGKATPPAGTDFVAVAAAGGHNIALKSDGSLVGWGRNDYGQATPPAGTDYVAVAAGFYHSLALKCITIMADIKPQSCPNPLNVNSQGVVPVAILGTHTFDVNDIDPNSILLEGISPLRISFEDVAAPKTDPNECACTTAGPDGYTDLALKFDKQELVAVLGEVEDEQEWQLFLTGNLKDGCLFKGSDCIIIIRKEGKKE